MSAKLLRKVEEMFAQRDARIEELEEKYAESTRQNAELTAKNKALLELAKSLEEYDEQGLWAGVNLIDFVTGIQGKIFGAEEQLCRTKIVASVVDLNGTRAESLYFCAWVAQPVADYLLAHHRAAMPGDTGKNLRDQAEELTPEMSARIATFFAER